MFVSNSLPVRLTDRRPNDYSASPKKCGVRSTAESRNRGVKPAEREKQARASPLSD